MTQHPDNSNAADPITPMEKLLKEAAAAESAGVFSQTRIDASRLLRESSEVPVPLAVTIGRKWIPVVATIGLAAVVWSAMFYVKLSDIGEQSRVASQKIRDEAAGSAYISLCVSGPAAGAAAECKDSKRKDRQYDFDTDGDVDLLDISKYQSQYRLASAQ